VAIERRGLRRKLALTGYSRGRPSRDRDRDWFPRCV
jgi:hypothetical protein